MSRLTRTRAISLSLALGLGIAALGAGPAYASGSNDMPDRGGTSQGAQVYRVDLNELNSSGVEGRAILVLKGDTLKVKIRAKGLVPNALHPQHIHGQDGNVNATCPPASAAGPDGILDLADGLPSYGPVLLPLEAFPTAENGTINYKATFTVNGDLLDLSDEAIVLHGGFVGSEYVASLPVSCGEIN